MRKFRDFCFCVLISGIIFGSGFATNFIFSQSRGENVYETLGISLPGETEKRVVTQNDITLTLEELQSLTTYSATYTVEKEVEQTRFLMENIPIPGTTNALYISCEGIVKVGFNFEDIVSKIDEVSRTIYITIPKPIVLDNYIKWDNLTYKENNTMLNPIQFSQYQALIAEIEDEGLVKAEENNIYALAQENIHFIINNFFDQFDDYSVVIMNEKN